MRNRIHLILPLLACSFFTVPAVLADHHGSSEKSKETHKAKGQKVEKLVAVMKPTERSSVSGTVTFKTQGNGKVAVRALLSGLNPNGLHAIHIHEFGDLRAEDGDAAGGHYNPEGHPHGLPTEKQRHAGDFGNLEADENGETEFSITVDNLSLDGKKNPIIGRAVIVHAGQDDGGQPVGNAGRRIAQGVIGVMNADWEEED